MTEKRRPQDDLPYEVRMKYIIEDYRKINTHIDSARRYAEDMERENLDLKEKVAKAERRATAANGNLQKARERIAQLKVRLYDVQLSRDTIVEEMTGDLQRQLADAQRKNRILAQAVIDPTAKTDIISPMVINIEEDGDRLEMIAKQMELVFTRMRSIEERIGIVEEAMRLRYDGDDLKKALKRFSNAYGKIDSVTMRIGNFLDMMKDLKVVSDGKENKK